MMAMTTSAIMATCSAHDLKETMEIIMVLFVVVAAAVTIDNFRSLISFDDGDGDNADGVMG